MIMILIKIMDFFLQKFLHFFFKFYPRNLKAIFPEDKLLGCSDPSNKQLYLFDTVTWNFCLTTWTNKQS